REFAPGDQPGRRHMPGTGRPDIPGGASPGRHAWRLGPRTSSACGTRARLFTLRPHSCCQRCPERPHAVDQSRCTASRFGLVRGTSRHCKQACQFVANNQRKDATMIKPAKSTGGPRSRAVESPDLSVRTHEQTCHLDLTDGSGSLRTCTKAPRSEEWEMRLCLVEDLAVAGLEPLTLTRPMYELWLGCSTLGCKIASAFGIGPGPQRRGSVVRSHLVAVQRQRDPHMVVNDRDWLARGPVIVAN